MKKLRNAIALFLAIAISASGLAQTQSKEELQRKTQELLKEIEDVKANLASTRKDKKLTLGDLRGIERKIDLRNEVIRNIKGEVWYVEKDIIRTYRDIDTLQNELATLKQQYAQSIVYAYKNRSNYNFLNFLFSASNFSDVLKRISYLKTYRSFREQKAGDILNTQVLLKKKIESLTGKRQEKTKALGEQNKQMQELASEKKDKDKAVAALSAKESQLTKTIRKKESERKKVQNAIAAAIRREKEEAMRKEREDAARRKAAQDAAAKTGDATTAKTTTPPPTASRPVSSKPRQQSVLENTPEGLITSQKFEENRGRLPWPLDRGTVILKYGNNTVPGGTRGIEVYSPGLSIETEIGAAVKAIFDGEVITVSNLGQNKMIIVKHGKYFSTYSNLQSANVSRGQKVSTGQVLGAAGANDEGVGNLDFQLDTETSTINPEGWIRKR